MKHFVFMFVLGLAISLGACGGQESSRTTPSHASGSVSWTRIEKFLGSRKYEEVASELENAEVDRSESYRKAFFLGQAYEGLERPRDAEQAYRDAIAAKENFAEGHNNLGNLLREYGQLDAAAAAFARASELAPKSPEPIANLGLTMIDQGRMHEGMAELRRAIKLDPKAIWIRVYIVDALRADGKEREALKEAKAAAKLLHDDLESATQLSIYLRSHKAFDDAAEMLERVAANRANAILWIEFALVELGRGDIEKASKYAAIARRDLPKDGFVHYVSAVIANKRGDREDAIRFADIAVDNGPDDLRNQAQRLLETLSK